MPKVKKTKQPGGPRAINEYYPFASFSGILVGAENPQSSASGRPPSVIPLQFYQNSAGGFG